MRYATRLLLVEDSEDDALFFMRAIARSGAETLVVRMTDGVDAISYLAKLGESADTSTYPELIITDLKMPRCDGFGLLTWIQNHAKLPKIPTVVLSSSGVARDRERAFLLGATGYLIKPSSLIDYAAIWKTLRIPIEEPAPKNETETARQGFAPI